MNLSSFDDQFRTTDITSHHLDMMFSLPIYIDAYFDDNRANIVDNRRLFWSEKKTIKL